MVSESAGQSATVKLSRRKAVTDESDVCDASISRNLYGQRLGRKGRDTRDRIVTAADALLARPEPVQITLSAVAREASLGMTTLYLYFSDLTELLLAVLEPVMVTAEDAYLNRIQARWDDDRLGEECYAFMLAYHDFWARHTRILHLRNALADQHDRRMLLHRVEAATALIERVVEQMGHDPADTQSAAYDMGTVLMTGVERVVTMSTNTDMQDVVVRSRPKVADRMRAVARLMELAIREHRQLGAQ
ncbi:MAG TPA: TetR/AcrR family transcriptional regulator [Sphingobium sp.]|uniref:TetR/AcrR family transcriptional regulator n=1 Tax=Sphingobium sp. TaxID=1912891 RepID=UPI002ED2BA7F